MTARDGVGISSFVREKRHSLGLSQRAFALLLGLKANGERTVRFWESGENVPSADYLQLIQELKLESPFALHGEDEEHACDFRFIDLFAGIGGIRLAFQQQKGRCVFSSEWDRFAQRTYCRNFGEMPYGDISEIPVEEIEDHDVLLGGFPCQTFSQAGLKKGFHDTRGTMFFEIQRILAAKRPKAFMLENVKQLEGHDGGRTLATMLDILRGVHDSEIPADLPLSSEVRHAMSETLNYWVCYKVLNARDHGLPQNRQRIFLVGFDRDSFPKKTKFEDIFEWPGSSGKKSVVGDILEDPSDIDEKYTISDRLWDGHKRRLEGHKKKGNGFGYGLFNERSEYTNTISARYYKDGSEILIDQKESGKNPRKLTPRECARLQGFPEDYDVSAVSDAQIYKQFGNSVSVPVVTAVARSLLKVLRLSLERPRREAEVQTRMKFYVD